MAISNAQVLLPPRVLARVKDMPLIAKTVAEGFLLGVQPSILKGSGVEFSQYRGYEPGDPLSRIDWKLFGRSDRYYIRQAEQESETVVWLVVDASGSMGVGAQEHWNKLDYAKHLAATLAYIGHKQGDRVGLLILSSRGLICLPPATGQAQWQRLMVALTGLKSGQVFPSSQLVNHYSAQLQQPSLVFVISDFYQQSDEIQQFISQVSYQRNEVVALQLQSEDELDFNLVKSANAAMVRLKDLETGDEQLVSAKQIENDYFANLLAYQQHLVEQLTAVGVNHTNINISEPMDQVLANYLQARQSLILR